MLVVLISITLITTLLAYAYFSLSHFQKSLPFATSNVLILTAHPDDECMFFGPTITSIRTMTKSRVHVLCLSIGNADGLGDIRKKELVKSCQTFGIQTSHVKPMNNPELQDGMQNQWNPSLISEIIKDYVAKHKIDTIITFDDQGISGHPNHIAAYKGAKTFVRQYNNSVKLYRLESLSIVRKYIGIMDLLIPNKKHSLRMISPPLAYLLTHKAMRQHESQLVWFRWLYVSFSRYMFINDLILENDGL
ncbi:MAG: phosphatidylinositol glycan [Benjaminiella poitrasii]|nr:MAG: phosphatidylinositol glycan [Benjaminiella poitrasii]